MVFYEFSIGFSVVFCEFSRLVTRLPLIKFCFVMFPTLPAGYVFSQKRPSWWLPRWQTLAAPIAGGSAEAAVFWRSQRSCDLPNTYRIHVLPSKDSKYLVSYPIYIYIYISVYIHIGHL